MAPPPLPLETAALLRRSLSQLMRRLRVDGRERGFNPTRLAVLDHLQAHGATTPGALAQARGVQPQSLTRLLAQLEADGLARRRQDPRDRRQVILEITRAGQDALRREADDRSAWLAAAMAAHLSATEHEVLRLAAQLLGRLAEGPPAGVR